MNSTLPSSDLRAISDEISLVSSMCEFLSLNGYRPRVEVPNMGQYIDIVATKGRWVLAIEAKLHDWGRALQQLNGHYVVADFLAIGLARTSIPARLAAEAMQAQIGIILCNPESGICAWAIEPEINRRVWLPQRRSFAAKLKDIAYAN